MDILFDLIDKLDCNNSQAYPHFDQSELEETIREYKKKHNNIDKKELKKIIYKMIHRDQHISEEECKIIKELLKLYFSGADDDIIEETIEDLNKLALFGLVKFKRTKF